MAEEHGWAVRAARRWRAPSVLAAALTLTLTLTSAGCGPGTPSADPARTTDPVPTTDPSPTTDPALGPTAPSAPVDDQGRQGDDGVGAASVASTTQGGPVRPDDAEGPYPVLDVVDGDTIKVEIDGEKVTVRVIGIDTAETKDPRKPVQCFGREASAQAEALLDGQQVWLATDPTQDRYDRYDRLLAHVWLPDGRLFEWVMVTDGYAHEYTYDLPYEHQADLQAAERDAREHQRGLWSPSTCSGDTTTAAR